MRYTVIERSTLEELMNEINLMLEQGWLPTGGVCASVVQLQDRECGWDNQNWYAQAMTNDSL